MWTQSIQCVHHLAILLSHNDLDVWCPSLAWQPKYKLSPHLKVIGLYAHTQQPGGSYGNSLKNQQLVFSSGWGNRSSSIFFLVPFIPTPPHPVHKIRMAHMSFINPYIPTACYICVSTAMVALSGLLGSSEHNMANVSCLWNEWGLLGATESQIFPSCAANSCTLNPIANYRGKWWIVQCRNNSRNH